MKPILKDLLSSVYLPGALIMLAAGAAIPLLPLYAIHLGGSVGLAGTVLAARGLGSLLINLPSGILIDRLGVKRLFVISTIGLGIAPLAMAATRSPQWLLAWTFLGGGFHSTWLMTRVVHLREVVPADARGRAISMIGGLARVGRFLGPIGGGFLAEYFGFEIAFVAQAVIVAFGVPLVVRTEKASTAPKARQPRPIGSSREATVSRLRSFAAVGLVVIALGFVRSSRDAIFPLWGDSISLGVGGIGLVVGLSSGLDMPLFAVAGIVMDKKGRKWTIVPALFILSAAFLLLPRATGFAGLLIVGMAMGLGNGISSGIVMTLGSDLAPEKSPGIFLGAWLLLAGIGNSIGPFVIGLVAETWTLSIASLIVGGLGCVAALYALFIVPETRRVTNDGGDIGTDSRREV